MFLDSEELSEIAKALESHYSAFYYLWKVTRFIFTDNVNGTLIKKGGVTVSASREILFFLNPEYWKSIDFNKKLFLISHELVHLILNHNERIKNLISKEDLIIANACLDAIDNQILITSFGFDRKQDGWEGIYPDNLIPGQELAWGKSFEYYFAQAKAYGIKPAMDLLDDHLFDQFSNLALQDILQMLPDSERESISRFSGVAIMNPNKCKITWPPLFLRFLLKRNQSFLLEKEMWTKKNRKVEILPSNLALPSWQEHEQGKIIIFAFLDVSISCQKYIQNFFDLVNSLPNKFEKKIFAFSGRVSEIKETSTGLQYQYTNDTKFNCIETYLSQLKKYPDLVCVFTDGIGGFLKPKFPTRWHWFLSEKNTHYIPPQSNWYLINEIT